MNNENIDAETLISIKKMYKRYNIVYATNATLNNGNNVIAICLVHGFDIRSQKNIDIISSNTWITLNHMDIRDKKIILRFSKNSIELTTDDSQTLFESICDVVQRVLLPKELEDLNFSRFQAYPVYPTPYSVRKRISMIKKGKGIARYDESERAFDFLLKIASKTMDISEFPSLAQTILKTLPLMTFVKNLIIPELPDTFIYKELESILPYCSFIRHIKVSNSPDSHFSRFLSSIISNKSKISSLGFGPKSELTIDNLKEIRNKIVNSRIHSLELNNAIANSSNEELSVDFYNLFEGQLGSHLWSLNMNETMKINFNLLLPKIRHITSLSFEDCYIEINEFFSILCKSEMQNLTYLNLDKNDCADKIPAELTFPASLTHISVNDVSWKKNSLVSFFEFFMKQRDEIHLSIAHAASYKEQWDNLFEYMNASKCNNFQTLIWDRNPVEEKLINFLKQNDKLSYLSMSECFSHLEPMNEKSLILSIARFIKETPSLKTLIIEGGEVYLGEKFPVIVDACILHPSLSVLDLSFSKCGNVGLAFLIPLIKRGKLNVQVLNIEGTYVEEQDPTNCIQLFKEIAESASDVFVSFPSKENEELIENKTMKEKQNFQLLFRSKNTFLAEEEHLNSSNDDQYVFKKYNKSPFYLYPLNYYSPEPLFPLYFEDIQHNQLNLQASKRRKNVEREKEEEEESEFAFVNDENEEKNFSEMNQRKIIKTIVRDMPSPKSPNAIAIKNLLLSESEYSKNIQNNENSDLSEYSNYYYSTYTTTAAERDQSFVSNHTSYQSSSKKQKNKNRNIESVSLSNNIKSSIQSNQNDDTSNAIHAGENDANSKYVLSEFNKEKINSFKEKYEIKRTIPFPKLMNPNQIMDEKWNQIDLNYSLEDLYMILKDQKNSVPNQ